MKKFLVSLAVLGSVAFAAPAHAWVGFSVNVGGPGYYGYGYPAPGVAVGVVAPPVAVVPPVVGACGWYGCGAVVAPPVVVGGGYGWGGGWYGGYGPGWRGGYGYRGGWGGGYGPGWRGAGWRR